MDASRRRKEIAWQTNILPGHAKQALDYLAKAGWLGKTKWYLAGGTAMALQVGHRSSQDLDFFNPEDFSERRLIKNFPPHIWKTEILREGTIYGRLLEGKVSFIFYPFFAPKQPFLHYGSVSILDQKDIAVMKVIAISQRGTKRDFVDLYWYCQNREPLLKVVNRLSDQYPTVSHNYHHVIKSLTYFADAEIDPMPRLFFQTSWNKIKKFFQSEVPKVTKVYLGLK